jgi:hypothetical protein
VKHFRQKETAMYKPLGIILIGLGLLALVWGGFSYTTQETVVDVGPIHATRDKLHTVPLAPIAGGVLLLGGVVMFLVGNKHLPSPGRP